MARIVFRLAMVAWIVGSGAAIGAPEGDDVKLEVATPKEVDATIADQKGKIVVVDIWATWCIPCKKEFPHLVVLHKEHAKDGVACMSIAMDTEKQHDNALKFLKEKGAAFANFRMERDDDATSAWQEKHKMQALPVVLVFGRDGNLAKKFEGDTEHNFSYDDVNKLVAELLKK
jgi:thiol-disulfide isomerase/thioredoxin